MNTIIASLALAATVASASLTPPSLLTSQAGSLKQIDRLAGLPQPIVAGAFTVDGTPAKGWEMSDPGGPFNATDVVSPGSTAPGRRLLFGACNASVCAVVYERGGIAHFYELLAFAPSGSSWKVIWNARGPKPLANLAALQAMLAHPASSNWQDQWVKGDF
jgi:hypothetical protein